MQGQKASIHCILITSSCSCKHFNLKFTQHATMAKTESMQDVTILPEVSVSLINLLFFLFVNVFLHECIYAHSCLKLLSNRPEAVKVHVQIIKFKCPLNMVFR